MSDTLEKAITALEKGQFIILVDDENQENEGDLVLAAEKTTPQAIAFMIRYTTGIICMSMLGDRLDRLLLPQMVSNDTDRKQTAFTISVDSCSGIKTGVSAADRSKTILDLINPSTTSEDLCRPGHIFPLRYKEGGVLKRAGHTEASIDLIKMCSLYPAGVIGELINDDGTMMQMPELQQFSSEHDIPIVSIADLVRFRRRHENLITLISQAKLPTAYGDFKALVYESKLDGIQHMAVVKGDVRGKSNILVRVHSECLTGDVFNSKRCDCGTQLDYAMNLINQEGLGVLVYLRGHEGRGIGLGNKIKAYSLQEQGRDTVDANLELGFPIDSREYGIGAQILTDLGLTTIRLMTNNPAKYSGLSGYDLSIIGRVSLPPFPTDENRHYLKTKHDKMGHYSE